MNAITKAAIEALRQASESYVKAEETKDAARAGEDEAFRLMAEVVFTSAARVLNWAVEDFLIALEKEEPTPSPKCATPGCALTPGHGGATHFGWAGSFEAEPLCEMCGRGNLREEMGDSIDARAHAGCR